MGIEPHRSCSSRLMARSAVEKGGLIAIERGGYDCGAKEQRIGKEFKISIREKRLLRRGGIKLNICLNWQKRAQRSATTLRGNTL